MGIRERIWETSAARILTGALIVGAATVGAAVPAKATVGQAKGSLLASDDARYVAYLRVDGTPVVFDSGSGRTREIAGAEGCPPEALGGNRVLLVCEKPTIYGDDPPVPPRTASVKGGRSVPVPDYEKGQHFDAIGRFWLKGSHPCGGSCPPSTLYKDWRNGRERSFWPTARSDSATRNPDTRDLRRLPKIPFEPAITPGPFDSTHGTCFDRRFVVTDFRGRLQLWRGPHRPETIGRGDVFSFDCRFGSPLTMGSGLITWTRGGTLYAYVIATRVRLSRKPKRPGPVAIVPVRGGIVTAEPTGRRVTGKAVTRVRFEKIPG